MSIFIKLKTNIINLYGIRHLHSLSALRSRFWSWLLLLLCWYFISWYGKEDIILCPKGVSNTWIVRVWILMIMNNGIMMSVRNNLPLGLKLECWGHTCAEKEKIGQDRTYLMSNRSANWTTQPTIIQEARA